MNSLYYMLKGEIYEIQGILYLILSYQVYQTWASWLLFTYGIITIAIGGYISHLSKSLEEKEEIKK